MTAHGLPGAAAQQGGRSADQVQLLQERVRSQVRAFIFDLDGVIAWTEGFHHSALNAYLAAFDCTLTPEQFKQLVGKDSASVAKMVIRWFALPLSPEQLTAGRMAMLHPLLDRELKPAPGLLPLLRFLRRRGVSMAVASNSPRAYVEDVIQLLGLSDDFDCIRAGEDVLHGKPAPDLYLAASDCLGVPSGGCVAVEDSPAGVRAACASGMIAIVVPNGLLRDQQFPEADLRFDSLSALLDWLQCVLPSGAVDQRGAGPASPQAGP